MREMEECRMLQMAEVSDAEVRNGTGSGRGGSPR